jgi:hypothetical protein
VTGAAVDTPPTTLDPVVTAPVERFTRGRGDLVAWFRRPILACLALFVVYAGLSLALNDPRGTLGTDTGGKLATLHMMERNGGLDPDIGYWAERYDPRGELQSLHYTYRVGDKWVNVTTLPMLYTAYPLYLVGGDRAVLILPMLGAVLCALAARALARRLGGGDGWAAFWTVGLMTPVAIYALDFWEHTIGLTLMLWASVLLLDVVDRRAGWRAALGAGLLFGAAATMRTEALVYLVVATGLACLVTLVRDRALIRSVVIGASALVGAAGMLVLERLLEQATLGADLRGARVAGTAAGAGTSLATRAGEAFTTTIGLGLAGMRPTSARVVGVLVALMVGVGAWALTRWELTRWERTRVVLGATLLAMAVAVYVVRLGQGLGFVPGLLTASPFACVGLVLAWRSPRFRLPAVVACVALPIAWASQFSGGADPQWGGRYVLLSSALLAVVGVVALRPNPRVLVAVAVVAGFVTAGGFVWLSVRSHTVADGMDTILARHDEVVISRQSHMLREGGAFYDSDRRWLTATTDAQLRRAVRVARKSGARELALIGGEGQRMPSSIGGYARGSTQLVSFLRPDVKLAVVTYRLTNGST